MNTKLLSMRCIATAPRHSRRKRARFVYRGFFGTVEGALFLLMLGFMVGVGFMTLLSRWGV
jgi:hypothetical protein